MSCCKRSGRGRPTFTRSGAVSKGRKGEELAELGQLVAGGAVAFTDDGAPVASAVARCAGALQYAKMFDRVIMQHCQVPELTTAGS